MDSPSGSRTRASPANDGAGPTTPQQQQQQQQQQLQQPPQQPRQASPSLTVNGVNGSPGGGSPYQAAQAWTPSPTAQPFYPQFYPQGAVPIPSPPIGVGVNGSPLQGAPGGVGVPNGGPLPPPMHAGQAPPFMHMQGTPIPSPYYDPNANAQFAQWYHHMMLQQMGQFPQQMQPMQGYAYQGMPPQQPQPPFAAPPTARSNSTNSNSNSNNGEYSGFHPYRRPTRGQSQDASSQPSTPVGFPAGGPMINGGGMNGGMMNGMNVNGGMMNGIGAGGPMPPVFQPPYARPDAAGSTSSVGSGSRPRTDSNRSANSNPGASRRSPAPPPPVPTPPPAGRAGTPPSAAAAVGSGAAQSSQTVKVLLAHGRQSSTASSAAASSSSSKPVPASPAPTLAAPSSTASPATSAAPAAAVARTPRPSPLSQTSERNINNMQEMSKADKRMSRDDSDLAALKDPGGNARSAGFKGRLRKAFTTLQEEGQAEQQAEQQQQKQQKQLLQAQQQAQAQGVQPGQYGQSTTPANRAASPAPTRSPIPGIGRSASTPAIVELEAEGSTPGKKKRALFNSKFNRSTDNISISSVSSSASVMIRKLGSLGKLARRNSIAGITSLFKDKDKDKDGEDGDKKDKKKDKKEKEKEKDKKKGKGTVAEAQVSHVTAELDAGEWSAEMSGLSPAARLARQHTLKTNAEAAAIKARKEAEAAAVAAAEKERMAQQQHVNANGVPVWDNNTATRSQAEHLKRVGEDGRPRDDDGSDEGSEDGTYRGESEYGADAWDDHDPEHDDQSWAEVDHEDADTTIRQGLKRVSITDDGRSSSQGGAWPNEDEDAWAVGLRRSVERAAVPLRGILKNAANYNQTDFLEQGNTALTARARSNSYGGMPAMANNTEVGPLARIPSPDPDHIDGLQRHGSHSSGGHQQAGSAASANASDSPAGMPFLPAFTFEGGSSSPIASSPTSANGKLPADPTPPTPDKGLYNLPNSSAPALSQFASVAPPLAHRAVTAQPKKLSFATSLSVYDTFPPTAYDRRSEPGQTASRLTPALAQRIKEELNSFKMEEMEVHQASRINTQFFV